ncbi:MAG: N-acetyltransferase family protein [Acidimicrobiia bacterium]
MESARPAGPDDVPAILAMAGLARVELLAERGGELWAVREAPPEPRDDELHRALEDEDRHLVVGELAGHPVGYGVAHVELLRDGRRLAVVSDVFVEPAFRGVAVGEAIMDTMIDWARVRGCAGIDSLVLPGMRESKNFFERYGMKARALLVHRSLVDDAAPGVDLTAGEGEG